MAMELEIEQCEEILKGQPIDWVNYIPAGGDGWQRLFREEIAPTLKASREKAERTKRVIAERLRNIQRVRELAIEIQERGNELTKAAGVLAATEEDALDLATRISGIVAGARGVFNFADALQGTDAVLAKTRDIDEDIRFFDAFTAYIKADAELDRLLYALPFVTLKYRVKIFRAVLRLLNAVETNREAIRNSKSVVLKNIEPRIKPLLDILDSAYASTSPAIRRMKKDYAKRGSAALAEFFNY